MKLDIHTKPRALRRSGNDFDDAARQKGTEKLPSPSKVTSLGAVGLVAHPDKPPHREAPVALARKDVQEHPVRHVETGSESLRGSDDEPLIGLPVPVGEVVLGGLPLDDLLALFRLLPEFQVLDHMIRGLRHHEAFLVEALPARASGDLVEIAGGEDRRLVPVEFAEPGEEHRPDRHVDAHTQRVRAADDLEESLLGELFDQHPVLGKESRVVHTYALPEPLADLGAVGAREADPFDRRRYLVLLLTGREPEACEGLRAVRGVFLREVNDVDRRLVLGGELFYRLRQGDLGIGVVERNGSLNGLHRDGRPTIPAGERLL